MLNTKKPGEDLFTGFFCVSMHLGDDFNRFTANSFQITVAG